MNIIPKSALAAAALAIAAQATAQVTFYERDGFAGDSFTTDNEIKNLARRGFNDRASSVVVRSRRWEVCEDARFEGRCVVLRPGQYPSLRAMGLNDRISSVREVGHNAQFNDDQYAPAPLVARDFRRHDNERLYQADVVSVRAVVSNTGQRCWVEREQVVQERGNANVGGAVLGAVIGGILGHQVGAGSGKDAATAVGAVAGAAIGANTHRDGGGQVVQQEVQHCTTAPSHGRADYWDVTYTFRGQEHRMQRDTPPGATVTVNAQGEPRA